MGDDLVKLDTFVKRLKKIGIEVECIGNYPWIYLHKINGKLVREKYLADHGFTMAWLPVRRDMPFVFTDISEIFKLIRKYHGKKND